VSPFVSEAQRRFLYAKHPEIAKRWSREFPGQKNLPQHATGSARLAAKLAKQKLNQ
jgi:hypothetical protein